MAPASLERDNMDVPLKSLPTVRVACEYHHASHIELHLIANDSFNNTWVKRWVETPNEIDSMWNNDMECFSGETPRLAKKEGVINHNPSWGTKIRAYTHNFTRVFC